MRVYLPGLPNAGEVALPTDEASHAIKVMRLRVGDAIELFDGVGNSAFGRLVFAEKSKAVAVIDQYHANDRSRSGQVIVGVGLPKGDRQKSVIERATELGVDTLVPIDCEFGVAVATDNAIERARRTVIESCKQCRRNTLMTIDNPYISTTWFSHRIAHGQTESAHSLHLICHPGIKDAISPAELFRSAALKQHPATRIDISDSEKNKRLHRSEGGCGTDIRRVYLAIGPEGGFSDGEVASALQVGWKALDLGALILRVETALTASVCAANALLKLSQENESQSV